MPPSQKTTSYARLDAMKSGVQQDFQADFFPAETCLDAMKSGVQRWLLCEDKCEQNKFGCDEERSATQLRENLLQMLFQFECDEERSATSEARGKVQASLGLNAMKSGVQRLSSDGNRGRSGGLNAMKSGVQPSWRPYKKHVQPASLNAMKSGVQHDSAVGA